MDEKDFELLEALDETRNITHAADKLYMTQSALSKRIKSMEQELGVEILLRSRQGIRFTPAGEKVLERSRAALRQMEQLGIASLSAEETAPQETGERPSIVLRQMAAGETLWDIAKAYQTTVNEIQQANDMEDQPTEPGVLLLIPRTR